MFIKLRLYFYIFLLSLFSFVETLSAGVYDLTAHGNKVTGVMYDPSLPRASCGQCHTTSDNNSIQSKYFLRMNNDNQLCFTCHGLKSGAGIYPGQIIYQNSNHGTDSQMIWPGPLPPRRMELDAAGKCVNCHDPHGSDDYLGLIPSLAFLREENLCLNCHDGSPAIKNIAYDFMKNYSHPVKTYTNRHGRAEEGYPDKYAYYPRDNRHSECSDCHNAHVVVRDALSPVPPDVSNVNKLVSGVRVSNGPAGSVPTYQYRSPEDETPALAEYEICFKCHSSWTQQPPGQTDMGKAFNANNPSYHPVEAAGKNANIDSSAFVNNRTSASLVYCSDCHGSDNPSNRGPHGSQNKNILRLSYQATASLRSMFSTELCFDCHSFDVYANDFAPDPVKGFSRWNKTAGNPSSGEGHTFHVGAKQVTCYSCHDSHGSVSNPFLITTVRTPGTISFSSTGNGGSCSSTGTCHSAEPKSYVINYAR